MDQPDVDRRRPPTGDTAQGRDLKLVFACPDCGARGWARWAQLPRGMRCAACGGGFWIDSSGHVRSERRASKVRFKCPRCRRAEMVPKELLDHGVHCRSCGQRSYRGPDGRFHTPAELEKARREDRWWFDAATTLREIVSFSSD